MLWSYIGYTLPKWRIEIFCIKNCNIFSNDSQDIFFLLRLFRFLSLCISKCTMSFFTYRNQTCTEHSKCWWRKLFNRAKLCSLSCSPCTSQWCVVFSGFFFFCLLLNMKPYFSGRSVYRDMTINIQCTFNSGMLLRNHC